MSNPRTFAATSGGRTPRTDAGAGSNGNGGASADSYAIPERFQQTNRQSAVATLDDEYFGAMLWLRRDLTFNRLAFNVANLNLGPGSMRWLLYQRADGLFGTPAPLIAQFDVAIGASGRFDAVSVSGGLVSMRKGVFWVLYGQLDAGSDILVSTASADLNPMMNQFVSLNPTDFPTQFVTNIFASSVPPSIDATLAGVPSGEASSVMPVIRLITV